MTTRRPLRIVLTGINGMGKGTLAPLLARALDGRDGLRAHSVYAPLLTPAAAGFRATVLSSNPSPLAELVGYMAQHFESAHEIERRQLESPHHLVIDRGPETSYVYNCLAHGMTGADERIGWHLYRRATQLLDPDLTLYLHGSVETSVNRSRQQAESDAIQDRDLSYRRRLIAGYDHLASRLPRWATIDAERTVEEVLEQAVAAVDAVTR